MAGDGAAYRGGFGIVTGTAGEYGCSFDPVANALAAAGYVAARYRPLAVSEAAERFVPLLDSGYVTALGRIRERHERIVTRLRVYAAMVFELGEPPGRLMVDYCDSLGDALASMHERVRARSW